MPGMQSLKVERWDRERGGGIFVEKVKSGRKDPNFLMVGALTQHAEYGKSQSAATFRLGAMRNYTIIDPYNASLGLYPPPPPPNYKL